MDYSYLPLRTQPGLVTENSAYDSRGRWVSASNARWWKQMPEKIGGWAKGFETSLGGPSRAVHAWAGLDGSRYLAWGTHDKLWLAKGNTIYDITPAGMPAGSIDGSTTHGWGGLGWGAGPWGGGSTFFGSTTQPRTWTLRNWGEDLVANWRGGPIYVWQAGLGPLVSAAVLPAAPATNLGFFVSEADRHLVALGANDPMQIAWCSQQDLTTWVSAIGNTAGDKRLETGSTIVGSTNTQLGQLVLTDAAAYVVRYIGPPYIFGTTKVSEGHVPPIGPNAIISRDGIAYWMGPGTFHAYDGSVRRVPCDVEDVVMDNIHKGQAFKVYAGVNRRYNEIVWFYPDIRDGKENSRYTAYNDDGWSLGNIARTSWIDESVSMNYPVATDPNGTVYFHEYGTDADGAALPYFAETAEIQLGEGELYMHIRKLIPNFQRLVGRHQLTVWARDYPEAPARQFGPFEVIPGIEKISARIRGRSLRLRLESSNKGSDFRLGEWRAMARPHGGNP